jgi:hypothetical protein
MMQLVFRSAETLTRKQIRTEEADETNIINTILNTTLLVFSQNFFQKQQKQWVLFLN